VIEDRWGLSQSLIIKGQRRILDQLGAAVGTPVVYLKAAWADPVLYGGRGERIGVDVDVVVRPAKFEAFAAELGARGYERRGYKSPILESYYAGKQWVLIPPAPALEIDLHRAVANPIWFTVSADDLIDRAVAYQSVDGPILSLSAEDQMLFGAIHHANHGFALDGRHMEDLRRLISSHAIDWSAVAHRARAARARVPLAFLLETLRAQGSSVPSDVLPGDWTLRVRKTLASAWLAARSPEPTPSKVTQAVDGLLLAPLLSERPSALIEFAAEFAVPWAADRIAKRFRTRR
jgi:hypothetical protein